MTEDMSYVLDEKTNLPKCLSLVKELLQGKVPWQCEKVGARGYSADEVIAMMRAYAPEWF